VRTLLAASLLLDALGSYDSVFVLQTEVENVRPSDEDLRVVCEKMGGGGNQKMSAFTL
jgi:hypothetical protein